MECESVIVMPCDSKTFPDKIDARCLLYVALSRAKSRLMFVVSRNDPSPLPDLIDTSNRVTRSVVLATGYYTRRTGRRVSTFKDPFGDTLTLRKQRVF